MTHGYEFFEYDYFDLGDYFGDFDDWDFEIEGEWGEIDIYSEYESGEGTGIEGWD